MMLGALVLLLQSCASITSTGNAKMDSLARAKTQGNDRVEVSAVVLSDQESKQVCGGRMAKKDIQPAWLAIDNNSGKELLLVHLVIDSKYFYRDPKMLKISLPG